MRQAPKISEDGPVTEMAIVDTFTKLIFGEEGDLSAQELLIVDAFRLTDPSVIHDSYPEMGDYLRNLGVREMIQLVSRVQQSVQRGYATITSGNGHAKVLLSGSRGHYRRPH